MQNVAIVETIVKFHSSQKKTDLSIVTNVFKITNQHQEVVVDLADALEVTVEMTQTQDLAEEMTDHEKCLMQNVAIVETIVRFHSSQKKTDLSIVTNVFKITDKISSTYPKVINIPKIKIDHVIW